MPKPFHEELLYHYEGKEGELRKLVFDILKPLAKQGKMVLLNQTIQARVYKDGKITLDSKELKEINLEKTAVKSNPDWIPPNSNKEELETYTQTISDRLMEDLILFGKVFCARLEMYNASLDKNSKDYESQFAKMPECFEQIIHDNVLVSLANSMSENIDKDYDEEFTEMEKKLESKKPSRNKKA